MSYNLHNAINMRSWLGWQPFAQKSSISALEKNAHPAPQVGDSLGLLLPRVPCKGGAKLLDVSLSTCMPAIKCLCYQGQTCNALPSAFLLCPIHFLFIGMVTSMAASLPPVQLGTRSSAGRRSLPGGTAGGPVLKICFGPPTADF